MGLFSFLPTSLQRHLKRVQAAANLRSQPMGRAQQRLRFARGQLGKLPDYLVVGAQKCGSTSLCSMISEHPDVAPALVKEVHFFETQANFAKGADWYRAFFPTEKEADGKLTGEGTPLMHHPLATRRIAAMVPEARIIVILRDPVSRSWSQYTHDFVRGRVSTSFEDLVAAEEAMPDLSIEALGEDTKDARRWQRLSLLRRGRYAEQIERWRVHFPREQMLILFLNDLAADPQGTMDRVHAFLDLAPRDIGTLKRMNTALRNGQISNDTRAYLRAYFAPHDARLAQILDRPLPWANDT